jgi:Holliday junction resolvasome RuvABC endonuclease subunit
MTIILGCDASSTSFGYAVLDVETQTPLDYGVIDLNAKLPLGAKLKIIYDSIHQLVVNFKVDFCAIEGTYCKNVKTSELLSEVRAAVRLGAYPKELFIISTSTMKSKIGLNDCTNVKEKIKELKSDKSRATKMRNIKKQAVLELVNKRYNLKLKDDNISDALALAYTFSLEIK